MPGKLRPIRYGQWQRWLDAYHGWRDGRSRIPGRPKAPGSVTTPHREALIRLAQDAFAREHLEYRKLVAEPHRRIEAERTRLRAAQSALTRARSVFGIESMDLTEPEAKRRRFGEEHRPETVIVQRRHREHDKLRARAQSTVTSAESAAAAIEADLAWAEQEAKQQHEAAVLRVERIHEYIHRRLAVYRRALIRSHPDGAWANWALSVQTPEIPTWALPDAYLPEGVPPLTRRFPPPSEPKARRSREREGDGTDDDTEQTPIEPIRLGDRMVFGSEPESSPGEPFHPITDAAPRHFILVREGDRIRLHDFGHGNGPYINGALVKDAWLEPEEYFDFFNYRYQVSADGSCLEVYPLFPAALIVYGLGAKTRDKDRLKKMSFVQREKNMLAILGPSGAGKTSLFSALVQELQIEEGELYLGKLPLRTHGAQIRERLGFVPQDDTLFKTFTVCQLLRYAYELRGYAYELRGAGSKETRDSRVAEVCSQLGIGDQIKQLVGTLSGGERKRVSIAVELLNKPSLLMLDEPTSGLDAGMDLEVLKLLREYAEIGNTVMVITHSTEHLRQAHRVLVLAIGGRPVYFGSSRRLLKQLSVASYAELMKKLINESDSLAKAYQRGPAVIEARAAAERMARELPEADNSFTRRSPMLIGLRQFSVLFRRQVALIRTRGSLNLSKASPIRKIAGIATVVAPLLIAGAGAFLAGLVSGSEGLGRAHVTHAAHAAAHAVPPVQGSTSAATALSLLITLCMLTGQALTYSDIVNDYPTIRREHRTGTFTFPVVTAKCLVFGAIAIMQAALITWIYAALRPVPSYSLLFGHVTELFIDLAAMSIAAMTLGLLISAATRTLEQAIAVVTGVSIAQIALNGVASNLSANLAMNVASMFLPSRWGLAATAASVNLRGISPSVTADALWHHTLPQWTADMAWLILLTAVYFTLACCFLATRLKKPD
jgi:ABC transport system ATP-binding/permease protein